MRKKLSKIALTATLGFALAFTFGCSGGDDNNGGGNPSNGATEPITKAKITGFSQKGPFLKGSSVTLQELDGKTLTQTGRIFKGNIESDKGNFTISSLNLVSQYAFLEANGFYRNEVNGGKSVAQITLNALTDLSDRDNVNVNLLTHLEYRRVLHLIENEKLSLRDAKAKAENEIFKIFGVSGNFAKSEDLSIFSNTEGDAALLAISILLQGNCGDVELSELLTDISFGIVQNGTYDDEQAKQVKTKMADWAYEADLQRIRNNILSWNISESIPAFEKYVYGFWVNNYELGECTGNRQGEVKLNENKTSVNANVNYICDNKVWKRNQPPNHSELCAKKPITKECLAGQWYLEKVTRENGNIDYDCNSNNGNLQLEANGRFSFEGGIYGLETNGNWKLNEAGTEMEIKCQTGECVDNVPSTINAAIEINGSELKVTTNGYTSFSQCRLVGNTKLTEVFSWQGYYVDSY